MKLFFNEKVFILGVLSVRFFHTGREGDYGKISLQVHTSIMSNKCQVLIISFQLFHEVISLLLFNVTDFENESFYFSFAPFF